MSQATHNPRLLEKLGAAKIVPVLTIEDVAKAVPLAKALLDGGLSTLEITLRTPVSLQALKVIADAMPNVFVGAGTVLSPRQADAAITAGAQYLVSPGMSPALVNAAEQWPVPFLPGAATASEAMALADMGYRALKFFPAEAAGGIGLLKSLAAPLSEIKFCPTGGVTAANVADYLQLANVISIGGSWVAPSDAIASEDWGRIETLSRDAMAAVKDV
ncbi:MAG: bifunctional 4-hydroxy-2-oxoglutarate aldolase/2-dehydro-3-deoxy-phosphogluconate aldolase [Pseudomonadota bacterium]